MSKSLAIGIDLGGTNLKIAAVDRTGRIAASRVAALAAGFTPDVVVRSVRLFFDEFRAELGADRDSFIGAGVGSPGPLSPSRGMIYQCANLPGWKNVPLRDLVTDALKLETCLDNDANVAAFGEFWAGAGRDGTDMVMLTLGTGVGAGVVLSGRVFHGHFENAAELGHMIVMPDGIECGCGQRGCLEAYASASAVARRAVEGARLSTGTGEASAGKTRTDPTFAEIVASGVEVDARLVAEFAQRGDAVCQDVWKDVCTWLAVACINVQHAYNPARIVFGGGMALAGEFLLENVRRALRQRQWRLFDDVPRLCLAQLGYDAGVVGAAGLAWVNADG